MEIRIERECPECGEKVIITDGQNFRCTRCTFSGTRKDLLVSEKEDATNGRR